MNLKKHATLIGTVNGVAFYENPEEGDEAPLMIEFNGKAVETDFWDLPDALEFDKKSDLF